MSSTRAGWKTARAHIDFRNTIIILTSNVGTDPIACVPTRTMPEPDALSGALRQLLLEVFPPALLGRLLVVPYYPLSDEMQTQADCASPRRIQRRLEENHNIISEFDDSVVEQIVQRCTEVESGGRMVDAILTDHVAASDEPDFTYRQPQRPAVPTSACHLRRAGREFHRQFAA